VAKNEQDDMTKLEQDVETSLNEGVANLDKAIQLEQMRMIAVLGEDLKGSEMVDKDLEKHLERVAARHRDWFEEQEDPRGD
jgi:hypothetical protein